MKNKFSKLILVILILILNINLAFCLNIDSNKDIKGNINDYETFFINNNVFIGFISFCIYIFILYLATNYNNKNWFNVVCIFGFILGIYYFQYIEKLLITFSIFNIYLIIKWGK